MPFPLLVPAILAMAPPQQPAVVPILPTQKALDLLKEGKVGEALGQLDQAIARDPKDPQPLWIKAQVHRELAMQTKGWASAWNRECAEESAEAILELGLNKESMAGALVLLQHLRDDERPAPAEPSALAKKAFDEGEAAFHKQDWSAARAGYEKALKESPGYAVAALYIGDSYFAERRLEESIPWFRKAAGLNPADPRPWRYLADAQAALGRKKEAETTMIEAIQIFPGNRASWQPLAWHRAAEGRHMTRLAFKPGVTVGWDKDGKQTVGIQSSPADPHAQAVWMLLAGSILDTISIEEKPGGEKGGAALRSRFQQERFFWDLALKSYAEACRSANQEPKDRILRQFLKFQQDGQLDAAIFLLRYREAFRPDYEAWRKSSPGAVQAFLDRYNIRP
jgi:tetratricopeptide (TPR) repeat protein